MLFFVFCFSGLEAFAALFEALTRTQLTCFGALSPGRICVWWQQLVRGLAPGPKASKAATALGRFLFVCCFSMVVPSGFCARFFTVLNDDFLCFFSGSKKQKASYSGW